MKTLLTLSLLLAAFQTAQAREIEIDGERYTCEIINDDPSNAATCVEKAYSGPFNREESKALCQGARNNGPADCALIAYNGPFNRQESLNLCKGARSAGPGECAVLAYSGPFNREESLRLCSGRSATKRNAECALKAYAGVSSKEESIELCKADNRRADLTSSVSLVSKSVAESAELDKAGLEKLVIQANEKAFRLGEYK